MRQNLIPPMPGQDTPARAMPTLGLLPVIAMSAAFAGPAMAQQTTGENLGTVYLEGGSDSYAATTSGSGKRPTELKDTPKSVTVVTRKEMDERGATSLADILATTPGITIRAGEGGVQAGDNVYIRGFDASTETLIDGVRNSSRTSYESFNLESVEVTRGADGATTGAGAEGGSVNLNTKVPVAGAFDEVSLSYGTGNYKRATLDTNREFGALGLRLNAMVQDADDLGGKEGKTSKRLGLAPSLSYAISETTKVTAGLYYYHNEDMPDYGVRMSGATTNPEYAVGSGTAADPWQPIDVPAGTFYGTPGRDFTDNISRSAFVRLDHAVSDSLNFSATLRMNDDQTKYYVTQPGTSLTGVTRGNKSTNRETETLSFNAQLSGDTELGGMRHRFGIGLDLSKAETTAYRLVGTGTAPGEVDYVNPDLGHTPWTFADGTRSSFNTVKSASIYAFDAVELDPKWEATFGAGVTRYDVSNDAFDTDGSTVTSSASKASTVSNGSVGLVYKMNDNGRFYGSITTASKPVGLGDTPSEGNAAGNVNLDPETSTNYELGTKWMLFDNRLMLSANVFYTDKKNVRVRGEDGVTFDNIGETRSQGVELGFAGEINDRWGISGGYVYQDVQSVNGGFTTGGTAVATDGKQLAKVPRNSFSLWTTYAVSDAMTVGGGATYVDKRVASYNTAGEAIAELPDSWRVDLMASYQVAENTSLQLNVNNVFDEQIYGDSHVTQHVLTEPGRNFTLTLKHRF